MNINLISKQLFGLLMIAMVVEISNYLTSDNFILNVLVRTPMWMIIFIFLDWRSWVTSEKKEKLR